jgi:hypothetical protein
MERDNYLIEYDEIRHFSIENCLQRIKSCDGKKLSDLKVMDLSYHNGKAIYPGEGVYIFREGTSFRHVGKVSAMSFTERIAKHFDLRKGAWFNRLLKIICEKKLEIEVTDENLRIASNYAFKNLNLVLINFKEKKRIDRIERMFRASTDTLNRFKGERVKSREIIVDEY